MSRVGKYPVPVPAGVQVALQGRTVVAKGKLGELKLNLTADVDVEIANNQVAVKPRRDDRRWQVAGADSDRRRRADR